MGLMYRKVDLGRSLPEHGLTLAQRRAVHLDVVGPVRAGKSLNWFSVRLLAGVRSGVVNGKLALAVTGLSHVPILTSP